MKVILDREMLAYKLNKAIKFTPDKTIIPSFDNFMLSINNNTMFIVATDGNIQIKLRCEVKSKDVFSICIPAKLFLKTINLFRENEVIITVKTENKIELKSGKSKCNITLDCTADNFAMMPVPTSFGNEITMSQFMLKVGLKNAERFVDEKAANANLAAINIDEINNRIVFTGIEQHLFCRAAIKPISITKWSAIAIPVDSAGKVNSMLSDKGEITITHSGDKIRFCTSVDSSEHFEVMSVSAAVKFPDTERIYSKIENDVIVINTLELSDAMKRLKLYTEIGSTPIARVYNTDNTQEVKLYSSDTLTGRDCEEIISIVNPSGVIIDKHFINDSIIKSLAGVDSAEVKLHIKSGDTNGATCIIPVVQTEEEDIFNFLIGAVRK